MARDVVLRWRCCLSGLSFAATFCLVTYHAVLNDLRTINALPGSNVTFGTRADGSSVPHPAPHDPLDLSTQSSIPDPNAIVGVVEVKKDYALAVGAATPKLVPIHRSHSFGIANPKFDRPPASVDILSISSVSSSMSRVQQSTWGSHSKVRNFVVVTEDDDPDPSCHTNLTEAGAYSAAILCKRKRRTWPKENFVTQHFIRQYARPQWLQKKANPVGWLCAQRRVAAGLAKLGRSYRNSMSLPDYLMLVDDDTYVNMDLFEAQILTGSYTEGEVDEEGANSTAKVYAGCVIVAGPAQVIQFTNPFGGWGTFFSKGAIERLITPLFCNQAQPNTFEGRACSRITSGGDFLSESRYFKEGMSISDLMGAQASTGEHGSYCLHSDWAVGYFVNFYNISGVRWKGPEHSTAKWYPEAPQTRLHPAGSEDSFIYRRNGGNCKAAGDTCTTSSLVCHYMNSTQMQRVHIDAQNQSK